MKLSLYAPCVLGAILGLVTGAQADPLVIVPAPIESETVEIVSYYYAPSRVLYDSRPLTCFETMETAMRAKEAKEALIREREQLTPRLANFTAGPDSLYFSYPRIESGLVSTPDTRTDEQRLADEQQALDARKAALAKQREDERIARATKQAHIGRLIVLDAQWELGKACWRAGRE